MEWNTEKTLYFCHEYKKRPLLWKTTHVDYKNRVKRRDAIQELALLCGLDVKGAVSKIKSLRCYFHREKLNLKKKIIKSGSSGDGTFTSTWFTYKHIQFIADEDTEASERDTLGLDSSSIYREELEPLRQRMGQGSATRMPDYPSLKSSLYRQRKMTKLAKASTSTAGEKALPTTPRQKPQPGPSTSKSPSPIPPLPIAPPVFASDVLPPPPPPVPLPVSTPLAFPSLPQLPQRPPSPVVPPPPTPEAAVTVQWNSYATNMSTVMPNLLEDEKFVDVTLACEGQYIKCHKVILGACSSYFEELLSENPCQHPIILMKDFQFSEIKAIVEFIYRGSVNIAQEKLPDILQVANKLQIKGLMSSSSKESESEPPSEPVDTDDTSGSSLALFTPSPAGPAARATKGKPQSSKRKALQNTPKAVPGRASTSTSAEPLRKQPKLFYPHVQDDPESSSSSVKSDNGLHMVDSEGGFVDMPMESVTIKEESSFLDPARSFLDPPRLNNQNVNDTCVSRPFELLTVQPNIKLEPDDPQSFRTDPLHSDPGPSVTEEPSIWS